MKDLPIDERLEAELEIINDFKSKHSVDMRTHIGKLREYVNSLEVKDYGGYTKASKAYLTRATRRIITVYNRFIFALDDLHKDLFI